MKRGETVPFDFAAFFAGFAKAEYDFSAISAWMSAVYETVVANTTILDIWNGGVSSLSFLAPYLSAIFLVFSLLVAFFGKKLGEPIKFIAVFVVSFCLGVCYISPLLDPFVELPHWIMGVIVAAVCAVLYKFICIALVVLVIGYSTFMVVMRPDVLSPFLSENLTAALIVTAVVLILVFVFKKYTELLGFAVLGGWLTSLSLKGIYDYTTIVGENGWVLMLILTVIVSVPGFIVQSKMRRRF